MSILVSFLGITQTNYLSLKPRKGIDIYLRVIFVPNDYSTSQKI